MIFLGDAGYPLLPYLMTPKLNQLPESPSAAYTDAHIKARCSVERTIGVLKGRWRCLRKERALHYIPEFAGKFIYLSYNNFISNNCKAYCFYLALIVNATCVLHNISKHFNIPDGDIYRDEPIEEELEPVLNGNLRARGNEVRERIILQYFT